MIPLTTYSALQQWPDQVVENFASPLIDLFLRALNLVVQFSPLSVALLVGLFVAYLWKIRVPYRFKWRIPVALLVAFMLTLAAILWMAPTNESVSHVRVITGPHQFPPVWAVVADDCPALFVIISLCLTSETPVEGHFASYSIESATAIIVVQDWIVPIVD